MSKIISYIPKQIRGVIAFALLFLLLGFFANFGNELAAFVSWYVTFTYFGIGLNDALSLIVKVFAWVIPLIGLIYLELLFDLQERDLKGVFSFVSFLVTVGLTYLFKLFQDYFWLFFGVGTVLAVILIVLICVVKSKDRAKKS